MYSKSVRGTAGRGAGSVISFFISLFAFCFVFCIIMLLARNIDMVTGGSDLIGYSRDTGVLSFFGETVELPGALVNAVIGFPALSVRFVLDLLPSCLANIITWLGSTLFLSARELLGFVGGVLVDFLRLGL